MTPKQSRGQLRQIVLEMLPELLASELGEALRKENKERLDKMESNQRNLMSMIIRATTPPKKAE